MSEVIKPTGLDLLREPFPPHQISILPKPTKKKEEMDKLPKAKCKECGGYHATTNVIHLSYVGHAALTDRLLDADPQWNWEPVAFDDKGLPLRDTNGGLWIKLTVCGVTRLGYGNAEGKTGGDAVKELIGDALRNAAMRFGAALDLWHKGDLHADDSDDEKKDELPPPKTMTMTMTLLEFSKWKHEINGCPDEVTLKKVFAAAYVRAKEMGDTNSASRLTDIYNVRKEALALPADIPQ